jgi:hypothetical protein
MLCFDRKVLSNQWPGNVIAITLTQHKTANVHKSVLLKRVRKKCIAQTSPNRFTAVNYYCPMTYSDGLRVPCSEMIHKHVMKDTTGIPYVCIAPCVGGAVSNENSTYC